MAVEVARETSLSGRALVERYFTKAGENPFDQLEWETRSARVGDHYHEDGLEFPASWSQNATDIVAQKYFAYEPGDPRREKSVMEMISRVVDKITNEAIEHGYLDPDDDETIAFHDELCHILVNQMAAFNSPVWFNVGVEGRAQQCSACYILGIEDTMESILDWGVREGRIFKLGSGSGINLSALRGSSEKLSTKGSASGPVSFMRGTDAWAGTIKSGGATRRAAKLVCLNADHPDILDFVWCKAKEEERLLAMRDAGIDISPFSPEGERTLAEVTSYQNANNSVRVTDEFMEAVVEDRDWELVARKTGEVVGTIPARQLFREIAEAAWHCADPGLQFDTTYNAWHTTLAQGRINATNPCSEYASNDDTSCNLASINLVKFIGEDGVFDVEGFRHTCQVMALAQDVTVAFGDFPTEEIATRSRAMRQIGLGYTNLGAALMRQGLAYDSNQGRRFAASVTALMTGEAYLQSTYLAERVGPFEYFEENRVEMLKVLDKHYWHADSGVSPVPLYGDAVSAIESAAYVTWSCARDRASEHGVRNAQATVLAPAGTISFLMDCDTTGVEPAFSLLTYKKLAGGGDMILPNMSVPIGMAKLGYSDEIIYHFVRSIKDGDPSWFQLHDEHRAVFACANEISAEGHLKMMAAVQPFISGSISKTINLPETATAEDIGDVYMDAWKLGLKSVAVYRDGSKASQVLASKKTQEGGRIGGRIEAGENDKVPVLMDAGTVLNRQQEELLETATTPTAEDVYEGYVGPERRRMPRERHSITHKFSIGGHEGYITAGMYEDGSVGEIFLTDIGKEGSTLQGMMNAFATAISIALQYGVPLEMLCRKFSHMRFDPEGLTENPEIRIARSLPDYIMRWLASRFLGSDIHDELGIRIASPAPSVGAVELLNVSEGQIDVVQYPPVNSHPLESTNHRPVSRLDGPACMSCGGMMQRTGSCYSCPGCGANTGCG